MKRAIALFLALVFVFGLIPASALAAEKSVTFNVTYKDLGGNNITGSPVSFTRTYDDTTGVLLDGQESTQVLSYEQSDKVVTNAHIEDNRDAEATFDAVGPDVPNPSYSYTIPQGTGWPGTRTTIAIVVTVTCDKPKVTFGTDITNVKADGSDIDSSATPDIGAIITGTAVLEAGTKALKRVTAGGATVTLDAETGAFQFTMPKANVAIAAVYGEKVTLKTTANTVLETKHVAADETEIFTVTEPADEFITATASADLTIAPNEGTVTYDKAAGTVTYVAPATFSGAVTISIPSEKLMTVTLVGCEVVSAKISGADVDYKVGTGVAYVETGTDLTLRATFEAENYKWLYNTDQASEKSREFTASSIGANCTITAAEVSTFTVTKDPAESSKSVTITEKDKDGKEVGTAGTDTKSCEVGNIVTISAPADGFKRWQITRDGVKADIGAEIGVGDLTKNPLTFGMPGYNLTVLPVYAADLVVTDGTVKINNVAETPDKEETVNGRKVRTYKDVASNADVTIIAKQPDNDGTYKFVNWTSNSTRVSQSATRGSATMTFKMPPDNVNVEPVWQTYTLYVRRYVDSSKVETYTLRPGEYITLDAQLPTGGTVFNYWSHTAGMLTTANEVLNNPKTQRLTIQMPANNAFVTANYLPTNTNYKMTGAHIVMVGEPVRYYALREYFNTSGMMVYYYPNWEEKDGVLIDNSQLSCNVFDPASGNTNSVLATDGAFVTAGKFALQLTFYVNGAQMAETITVLNTVNTYINVSNARPEYVAAYAPNNVLNQPVYYAGENTATINKDGLVATLVAADHTVGDYNSFRTLLPSEYELVILNPLTGYDADRIPDYTDIEDAVVAKKAGYKEVNGKYYVQLGILCYDENQVDSATGKPKEMRYVPGNGNDIWIEVHSNEGIDIDLGEFTPVDEVTTKSGTWPSYSWEINYSELSQARTFTVDLPDAEQISAVGVTNEDPTVAYVTVPDSKNPTSYRLIPRSVGVTKFTFYVRGFDLLDADKPNEGDATAPATMVTLEVTVRDDVGGIIDMTNLESLNQSSMTMYVGSKTTLYPAVYSPNNANTTMNWSVAFKDDKTPYNADYYVKIDPVTGVIEALKYTDRVIYAYGQAVNYAGEKSVADAAGRFLDTANDVARCEITLAEIPVNSMTLYPASMTLFNKASATLTAKLYPDAATDQKVNWTSSNSNVVSVDNEGRITANMLGTATITATSNSNSTVFKTCTVTVQNSVLLSEILLDRYSVTLGVDDSTVLTPYYAPATATTKSVTWTSSNPAVATISAAGKVNGVSEGMAVITAMSNDGSGKSATCVVSVSTIVASAVVLNKQTLALIEDETETLVATVYPTNVSNAKIKWTSSNEKVATVDPDGVVTATGGGSAVITAAAKDSSTKYADCVVAVTAKIPVTSLTLNLGNFDMLLNDTTILKATVAPTNANAKLAWSSSNTAVASVDENGKVSALATGEAVIACKAGDRTTAITVSVVTKTFSTGKVVNCARRVNVRAKASGTSTILGYAYLGDVYKVLDKSTNWYKIQYNAGTVAYIWSRYLSATETGAGYVSAGKVGSTTTDTTGTTGTTTPVPVVTAKTLTITNCTYCVNVRSGAGTTFSRLGYAYLDEAFTYTGTQGDWYIITYNGAPAYVSSQFVKVN